MLILSHDDVVEALSPEDCAQAMASVLAARARGETYMPLRSIVVPPDAEGFMGLMPSWGGDPPVFALKALALLPGNPARGLDAHQGLVILFDGHDGIPAAVLDASAVTEIRTAAVTAVATRTLARKGARVLAILGTGVQGKAHLRALGGDFEEVRTYSPSRPGAAGSAEQAVRGADVVVTATSSREPVLEREWLKAGAHVNAVGASTPSDRELDTATIAGSALFCDSRESVLSEAGEFQLAVSEGAIAGEDHIRAELGEVLIGKHPGRTSDDELTVFRSLGIAVEDLAAAQFAVRIARERGLGTEVPL